MFQKLENTDNLSEAISYSKEEFGSQVTSEALEKINFANAAERDNEWAEVSSVVGSLKIDENKSEIQSSLEKINSDGEIENSTLKSIYQGMVDKGVDEADALDKIKTMLQNEGISDGVDDIKSIAGVEASGEVDSTNEVSSTSEYHLVVI